MALSKYEQTLLDGWEDVYKKSQLTLWILVSLKDGPKHMAAIKEHIYKVTNKTINADDKSMYRALRRFHDADLVSFYNEKSDAGPDLKIYKLTQIGVNVLESFIKRNVHDIYYETHTKALLG